MRGCERVGDAGRTSCSTCGRMSSPLRMIVALIVWKVKNHWLEQSRFHLMFWRGRRTSRSTCNDTMCPYGKIGVCRGAGPCALTKRGSTQAQFPAPPNVVFVLGLIAFSSCAPSSNGPLASSFSSLAVSNRGEVAWTIRGQAWVARAPDFTAQKLAHPANASSIAWRDQNGLSEPWVAMPGAGVVAKASGTPASVSILGRPFLLTARCIFTLEGGVYSFAGNKVQQLERRPEQVRDLTGVFTGVRAGKLQANVNCLDSSTSASNEPTSNPSRAESSNLEPLTASADGVNYSAKNSKLEANSNAVIKAVSLDNPALEVAAGGNIVAVLTSKTLNVFRAKTLEPLKTISLEVFMSKSYRVKHVRLHDASFDCVGVNP